MLSARVYCSICCCQVSLSYVVPPIIMFLNKHPMVAKADLSSLSRLICGAASIGREMIEEFHNKNPNCHIGQGSFQVIISGAIKQLSSLSLGKGSTNCSPRTSYVLLMCNKIAPNVCSFVHLYIDILLFNFDENLQCE